MSDDLISRKVLLNEFKYGNDDFPKGKSVIYSIRRIIQQQPTAFDKEKVIEELENYLFEKYCVEGDENISEIVEKGGID